MINIIDAILALNPKALVKVTSEDYTKIEWLHGTEPISVDNIKTKFNELQSAYDASDWKRSRQAEYPTIAELTVALYDTDDKADIEAKRAAVKAKYPKP
tara:strand:- start:183 stop:479 length:297 start_codon:yes stop_codon:yes gene_type:complete